MEISKLQQLRNISDLSRSLRQSDLPEHVISNLSAQSLYMLIKHEGLESSTELVEAASVEQLRLILDFDLWDLEELEENRIWDWLEISSDDEENDLVILQKIANSLDLKIVAYVINKYVNVQYNEEATDAAPGPLYFSPDKGFTWIQVMAEDQRVHFLISKLLAYLFESNSDIFYQLLATKTIITPSLLTDEALKDRSKRLASEGFPEQDLAQELCSFLSTDEAVSLLNENNRFRKNSEAIFSEPLVKISNQIEPLTSTLSSCSDLESALSEICLIVNACFVRFNISTANLDKSELMSSQVQGAINLGLELLIGKSGLTAMEIVDRSGFQVAFRLGLTHILDLSKAAKVYHKKLLEAESSLDHSTQILIDFLTQAFPCIPNELSQLKEDFEMSPKNYSLDDQALESNYLDAKPVAIRFLKEIQFIKSQISLSRPPQSSGQ